MKLKWLYILCLAFVFNLCEYSYGQFYQGSYQEFGKSRVQYNGFSWKYHNYKRFRIYYDGINEDIAAYTARTLHHYLSKVEEKLDYSFPEKLEVIVYSSQSKFRQSNLGLNNDEQSNVGGTTRIVGSKIFMYYEGDHLQFNDNIKAAVYEVILRHMFFGGDWKDQLKSTVYSGMPEWLEQGLVAFFVKDWDPETESRVKDLILTMKIDRFNDLTAEEKVYAGHALWNYIAETQGLSIIPSIIYITRITKSVEKGFKSLLNMDFQGITSSYISFYRARYIEDYKSQTEPEGELLPFKHKKESVYYSAKLSPDGDKLAYVENQLGRYRVKVLDLETGKTTKIFAAETKMERIQDYSYPVVEWHPNGEILAFFTERKGSCWLNIYSFEDKELVKREFKKFEKVLSFDYAQDGRNLVISTSVQGQTDLYLFDMVTKALTQMTNDIYDDLYPRFIDNDTRVIFSSNRIGDTIDFRTPEIDFMENKFDLYIYKVKEAKANRKILEQVTDTPDENELQAYQIAPQKYVYLSDQNGLYNRMIAEKDSSIAFIDTTIHYSYKVRTSPQTNYVTSIREHHVNRKNQAVYIIYQNSKFKILQDEYDQQKIDVLWNTTYKQVRIDKQEKLEQNKEQAKNNDTILLDNGLKYQKEVLEIGSHDKIASGEGSDSLSQDSVRYPKKWKPPIYTMYDVNFAKDFVLSQFDNNFLFPNYQPYSGPGSVYFNPGMNMLLKIGASDLFDDFKLLGGLRIPTSFNSGGEFLLMAEHLKNRTDHRLLFYRQKSVSSTGFYKWLTHEIRYRASYPISEILSVRSTVNVRKDKQIYIPYSDNSLLQPSNVNYNSGLNLELVFDNTIPMELNIRRGLRFKIFAEYLQELSGNFDQTYNVGLDFRHYLRIKRNFIWVNRFAAATSFGPRKLLYYMGAVDNWTFRSNPDFDHSINVDPNENFGFQTIATPMRGFIQNARNGSSFALINSEFRIPIFTYFSTYPIKSDALKHFQLVAFGDLGVAWTGAHPWSPDNYFNTQVINDKPVVINIENLREPIIGGFGFGARTMLWGYFVRFDVAWGVEDYEINKPRTYISLTKDI